MLFALFQAASVVHDVDKKILWVAVSLDLNSFDAVLWQSCSNDYVIHPKFKHIEERHDRPKNYNNDIALVKILLEPIKISGLKKNRSNATFQDNLFHLYRIC